MKAPINKVKQVMLKKTQKIYKAAPMPFMGQKRRFVSDFKEALSSFNHATIFVDLFGGSGLLSHIAKQMRPDAKVIYNDFDDYHVRIANCEKTNKLLAGIRDIVADAPRDKKLASEVKARILDRIYKDDRIGFVDYISLSSSLLFSSNYVTSFEGLKKATMYNSVRKEGFNCEGYLNGLEVVKQDYQKLFDQYKNRKDVVFFVDPPYLSTEVGVYKCYWRLSDYLNVLRVIKNVSYIYFTSEKSSIIELLEWFEENQAIGNPLKGAHRRESINKVNHQSQYKDIMLYKSAA